ncbi:hypothetical protein BMS3Bbin04_01866 [bacterium BMS3Bbin04]|nr:hypothetical protein BMS3Bbin04_01866 [bacterium BMS3Bbin04]
MVDGAVLLTVNQRCVTGERGAGKPHQVAHVHGGGFVENVVHHQVAIAEMVVVADCHAVGEADHLQRFTQASDDFVAVRRIICAGADGGGGLVTSRLELTDALERGLSFTVDIEGDRTSGGVDGAIG